MCALQLFLMKRGGEEIYVGPVGQNSSKLIEYFEVRKKIKVTIIFACCNHLASAKSHEIDIHPFIGQGIEGISKIKDGYNPATWMLEVSSSAQEEMLGIDFSEIYRQSELYQ
jgi:hypothetical protein